MPPPEWWRPDGLPFACTQCGNCCKGEGHVEVTEEDCQRLADRLGLTVRQFKLDFTQKRLVSYTDEVRVLKAKRVAGERHCVFLQDDKCVVHGDAPLQCRTYPAWTELVGSPAEYIAEGRRCPGITEGAATRTFIAADEVTRRLRERP